MFVVANQINATSLDLSYIAGTSSDGHLGHETYINTSMMVAPVISCGINKKFLAVKSAIDEWNPYSLLPEAPDDEFDGESSEIARKIDNYKNVSGIAQIVSDVFSNQFHEKGFTVDDCMDVAKKIQDSLTKLSESNNA